MIAVGDKIKVFKERNSDTYHKQGEYKKGVVLAKYPKFYLVWLEDNYRECFRENELERID